MAAHALLATLLTHALVTHAAPQGFQTEVPYYDYFNYDYNADIEAQEALLAETTNTPAALHHLDPLSEVSLEEGEEREREPPSVSAQERGGGHYTTPTAPPAVLPPRDPLADARAMAKLNIMERILIALGPPFGEKLPKAPTSDTLATVQTPINITTEPCPNKYKRCSSQTFFPSCDIPRNTAPEIWPQMFNLYFNLSENFDNKLDIINATLRLYKNNSLPIQGVTKLLIKAHVYTRSLTRRRNRTKLLAETQVTSDYIGWVTLSVTDIVKRWKRHKNNHGVKITVNDVRNRPWDAPSIFVTMDCAAGLVPLPFEVQTEQEGQQYPALNVRLGSPDDEPDTAMPSSAPIAATPSTKQVPPPPSPTMQGDDPAPLYEYNYESDVEEEENKERQTEGSDPLQPSFQPPSGFQDGQTEPPAFRYQSSTEAPTPPTTPPTPTYRLSQHTTPFPSPTPPMVRSRGSSRRRGTSRDMRHRRKHRGGHRRV
ncbi:uncharacterized protein LOC135096379 [Scylla paramamosain]|uniref:uncharacterized protein LOC135096379 n=1 Tax=Scylla paramamosain TaxID=85552 RepID=UPI0030836F28